MNTMAAKNQLSLVQGQRMIKECQDSGKTAAAWCAENGIARWKYFYWLRKVREATCEKMIVGGGRLPTAVQERMVFAELSQPACRKQDVAMTLKMDDFEMEIYNGADGDVIAHTIQALKNIC
jgi:hypothetical protein